MAGDKETNRSKSKSTVDRTGSKRQASSDKQCDGGKCDKEGAGGGGLPQPPEIVFSSGGTGWEDVLRDRFVDLCFGGFLLFLIIMYVYSRAGYDPMIDAKLMEQHPMVKTGIAMLMSLILGTVSRRCGPAVKDLFDKTFGMVFGLMAMSRSTRPGSESKSHPE